MNKQPILKYQKDKNKTLSNLKNVKKSNKIMKVKSNIFFEWIKIVFGRFVMYGGFLIILASLIAFGQGNSFGGKISLGVGVFIFGLGSFLKYYFRNRSEK